MKILDFDSVGGASGDMILGCLLDLGVSASSLNEKLSTLGVGPFEIRAESLCLGGLAGTRATVWIPEDPHPPHRHLSHIVDIIEKADLAAETRALAISTFTRLAEAEAQVHGTTPEKIHFHEVGAVDAIVDIVGSCVALHELNVEAVRVGPLPLGSGVVQCAHGTMPVPVPATVELLKGMATIRTTEPFELVTPTGAALLASWSKQRPATGVPAAIERSGYGLGQRQLRDRTNLLRATLSETAPCATSDHCLLLECNLDDTVPELIGHAAEFLLEAGALDVFTTPVQMKKQRPGVVLSVLSRPQDREKLLDILFTETTTFGIREQFVQRTKLERRSIGVNTPYGEVAVKVGARNGRDVTLAPEFESCVRAATASDVPVRQVYESAAAAAHTVDPAQSEPPHGAAD